MEIKDIIHQYRNELGISQEELGKRIGVSKQAIQKYESGTVTNLPYDKIVSLSRALCISPTVLLGIEEDSESQNLLNLYESLSSEKQQALIQYAKFLFSQQ